jgi:hypothetical protein
VISLILHNPASFALGVLVGVVITVAMYWAMERAECHD